MESGLYLLLPLLPTNRSDDPRRRATAHGTWRTVYNPRWSRIRWPAAQVGKLSLTAGTIRGKQIPENHPPKVDTMATPTSAKESQAPNAVAEHLRLGAWHLENNRPDEAESEYRKAIALDPNSTESHFHLGNIQTRRGRLTEAEANYCKALAIDPNNVKALNNLGNILKQQSRFAEAEASYRRAIEIQPDFVNAHGNLGVMSEEQGRFAAAETHYRRALEFGADNASLLFNLGNALKVQERLVEAEDYYRKALSIKPDFASAAINLGNMLKAQDRLADAVAIFRRTLEFVSGNADLCNCLANILIQQDQPAEARDYFRKALTLKPDNFGAASSLLFLSSYTDDESPAARLEAAKAYGRMIDSMVKTRYSSWLCPPQAPRLRVGLVSGDLRNHSVGLFLEGLLSHIDPARIELYAYPTMVTEDELSHHLRSFCKAWQPIAGMNDQAAASLIHADAVHILLDLSGHSRHNRLPLFAWRPAPVQASWLGYCATTGISTMDYYVADSWTVPASVEKDFTETVWRLPDSYLCFAPDNPDVRVSALPALTNAHVTFGSFNNLSKMGPGVVELWARVLAAVPKSRLFLKTAQLESASTCQRTVEAFAAHGVSADRLTLTSAIPDHAGHLAAYGLVDIALDTFPYNGVTTTAEALWMGVPVLTLAGQRCVSRQGLGLLMNAGLPDWVAADPDDYLAKAVGHAAELDVLAGLRARLRQQVLASPGFDAPRFARHFEDALWQMWQQHKNGYLFDIGATP